MMNNFEYIRRAQDFCIMRKKSRYNYKKDRSDTDESLHLRYSKVRSTSVIADIEEERFALDHQHVLLCRRLLCHCYKTTHVTEYDIAMKYRQVVVNILPPDRRKT